jgi:hypothetical protein
MGSLATTRVLKGNQKGYFRKLVALYNFRYRYSGGRGRFGTWTVRLGYNALYRFCYRTPQKRFHSFFGPKRCSRFFEVQITRVALKVYLDKISVCVRSQGESIGWYTFFVAGIYL